MKYIEDKEVFESSKESIYEIRKRVSGNTETYKLGYAEYAYSLDDNAPYMNDIIKNGKIDNEVIELCEKHNCKLMLKMLKSLAKKNERMLSKYYMLIEEVRIDNIVLYDKKGKPMSMPTRICKVVQDHKTAAYITDLDKAPTFGFNKYTQDIDIVDELYNETDFETFYNIVMKLTSAGKDFFMAAIYKFGKNDVLGRGSMKILSRLSSKLKMSNPELFDIDGFDFFGDDDD